MNADLRVKRPSVTDDEIRERAEWLLDKDPRFRLTDEARIRGPSHGSYYFLSGALCALVHADLGMWIDNERAIATMAVVFKARDWKVPAPEGTP